MLTSPGKCGEGFSTVIMYAREIKPKNDMNVVCVGNVSEWLK